MKKDFVGFADYSRGEIETIWLMTDEMKRRRSVSSTVMMGKTAALIFEKPSLRTHVSFEVAVSQLGGQSVFLSQQNIGLATREPVEDIAGVLSRYNDLIIARTMKHSTVEELARHSTVPVVNALTDLLHPCQILADVYTLRERGMFSDRTKITFIGDGNNMVNSWLELAEKIPFHFVLACPEGYGPDPDIFLRAQSAGVSRIDIVHDPIEAATDADVLYTDVWVSMGQEEERVARQHAFQGFQINAGLVTVAKKNCVVLHCLPAHRGEEITADVFERFRPVILDEAENRLHVQKGILKYLLEHHGSLPVRDERKLESVTIE